MLINEEVNIKTNRNQNKWRRTKKVNYEELWIKNNEYWSHRAISEITKQIDDNKVINIGQRFSVREESEFNSQNNCMSKYIQLTSSLNNLLF